MLYKKIHRQYLRQWRLGRKYKMYGEVCEVTREPYLDSEYNYNVAVGELIAGGKYFATTSIILSIGGKYLGHMWKDPEWLED